MRGALAWTSALLKSSGTHQCHQPNTLAITSTFSSHPVFRPTGTPGYQDMDYDDQDNLILWRSLEKKVLSDRETNRVYDVQELNRVSPESQALEKTRHTQVYEYAPGNLDSIFEVQQMEAASGRGFSKHIERLKDVEIDAWGNLRLHAAGDFGKGRTGEWRLAYNPKNDYLVSEADLWVANLDRPAVRIITHGTPFTKNGFTFASKGTIRFARSGGQEYRVEFSLLDYLPGKPDRDQLRSLLEIAKPVPPGIEVVDYTGPVPRRYKVDEKR